MSLTLQHCWRASARACLTAAALSCGGLASAAVIPLTGTLFDISYENSSFLYQTGTVPDPVTGSPVPFIEQLGGFSIVAPDTVRFSLRPRDVFGDPATIVPGGSIQVGGSALSTDSVGDGATFTVLPKGTQAFRVDLLTMGSFDNSSTADATLNYVASLQAGSGSGGIGLSLGTFSSGALPTGPSASFTQSSAPFDVTFSFTLDGTSSDPNFVSSANVDYIDFRIYVVPVPEPQTWLLGLVGLAVAGIARSRRQAAGSAT